jgi:hypothetical protein
VHVLIDRRETGRPSWELATYSNCEHFRVKILRLVDDVCFPDGLHPLVLIFMTHH